MNFLLFNKHSVRSYNCNWANLRNRFFNFIQSDIDKLYYFQHDKNDDLRYLELNNREGIIDFSSQFKFKQSNKEVFDKFDAILNYFKIDCIIGLNIPYSLGKNTYTQDYQKTINNPERDINLHDLLTHASLNGIKICHFLDDCYELRSADIKMCKFYSTVENDEYTYMPFIQYGAFMRQQQSINKSIPLTAGLKYYDFSCSVQRKELHTKIIALDKNNPDRFNLYYNTGNGASNKKLLRKNAWDNEIAKSYYTIATPNQDEHYLSIIRFLEALSVNCIPLIPTNVTSFYIAMKLWPDILEFYQINKELLFTDVEDLAYTINKRIKEYPRLIKEINSLEIIQNFRRDCYYNIYRDKFLDIMKG